MPILSSQEHVTTIITSSSGLTQQTWKYCPFDNSKTTWQSTTSITNTIQRVEMGVSEKELYCAPKMGRLKSGIPCCWIGILTTNGGNNYKGLHVQLNSRSYWYARYMTARDDGSDTAGGIFSGWPRTSLFQKFSDIKKLSSTKLAILPTHVNASLSATRHDTTFVVSTPCPQAHFASSIDRPLGPQALLPLQDILLHQPLHWDHLNSASLPPLQRGRIWANTVLQTVNLADQHHQMIPPSQHAMSPQMLVQQYSNISMSV